MQSSTDVNVNVNHFLMFIFLQAEQWRRKPITREIESARSPGVPRPTVANELVLEDSTRLDARVWNARDVAEVCWWAFAISKLNELGDQKPRRRSSREW